MLNSSLKAPGTSLLHLTITWKCSSPTLMKWLINKSSKVEYQPSTVLQIPNAWLWVCKVVKSCLSRESQKLKIKHLKRNWKLKMRLLNGWERTSKKNSPTTINIFTEAFMKLRLPLISSLKDSSTKSWVSWTITWRSSNTRGIFLFNKNRALVECIQKRNMTVFLSLIDELVQRGSLIKTIKGLSSDEVSRVVDFLRPLIHN